jgi:GTP-binding protein
VIVVNKADLISDQKSIRQEITNRLKSLSFCPVVFISALQQNKIGELIRITRQLLAVTKLTFGKKQLETLVEKIVTKNPPKFFNNGKVKIYYAKYQGGLVPRFIFFINDKR